MMDPPSYTTLEMLEFLDRDIQHWADLLIGQEDAATRDRLNMLVAIATELRRGWGRSA